MGKITGFHEGGHSFIRIFARNLFKRGAEHFTLNSRNHKSGSTVLLLGGEGRSLGYLCPLKVRSTHERALKVLDPQVLTLQQTLKLQVRVIPKISRSM